MVFLRKLYRDKTCLQILIIRMKLILFINEISWEHHLFGGDTLKDKTFNSLLYTKEKITIGFVGAGKAGFTLGKYMAEHGVHVSGYYSKSNESAKKASEFTHTRYYETLEEILASSDALFLTVPDGAIEDIWNSLKQYSLTDKLICHCSGAMSSAVFSGIDQMGAFGYSIHPLFAIHDRLQSYREISQAYFTIEGSASYLEFWTYFFETMGNPVRIIEQQNKILYHSAAVFTSNLVTGLFETGVRILMECGFDRTDAEKALAPLFIHNCENVAMEGAKAALTGPVERGDERTVLHHLKELSGEKRDIYISLSRVLTDIAGRKNPDRDYDGIMQILTQNDRKENNGYEEYSCNI